MQNMHNIVILILFLISCKDVSNSHIEFASLKGTVVQNVAPVEDVNVSIKSTTTSNEYETLSDSLGVFFFDNIPTDNYELLLSKEYDDGNYVNTKVDEIELTEDTNLNDVLLPIAVRLYDPIEITTNSVTLTWSAFTQNNFYEYKVYKHYQQAIDQDTGTLIYIATDVNDTTYCDIAPEEDNWRGYTYYYRVYVNNNYGNMSGSQIQGIRFNKWDNEDSFTVEYNLSETMNFNVPGPGVTSGIDSDGNGHLWVLKHESIGGYYDPDTIRVLKYDISTGEVLLSSKIIEYAERTSLSFDGIHLWIGIGATDNNKVIKINPETETIVTEYQINYGLQDMSTNGDILYLNYYYNLIEMVNNVNFSLLSSYNNPFGSGANNGIAYRPGEIWLTCAADSQMAVIDETGIQIGVANNDLLDDWNGYNSRLQICFIENDLALIKGSRIHLFSVE